MLLSDRSGSISFMRKECFLYLYAHALQVVNTKGLPLKEISCDSIIGARVATKKYRKGSITTLSVYAYDFIDPGCCSPNSSWKRRTRTVVNLTFPDNSGDTNIADNWEKALNAIALPDFKNLDWNEDRTQIVRPKKRRFLCIVNPVGGKRLGLKIWKEEVFPMLQEADIVIELVVTENSNHARSKVSVIDIDSYYAVLTVGGDGLIFEVINGLASRTDVKDPLKRIYLAPVAGGTSNGLVKSILHENNEHYSVINAVFLALRGSPKPMDLSEVTTHDGKKMFSFLILGWGIISDIDILSETMRCLGEIRLYIAAVYFVLRKRYYKGKLKLKLVATKDTDIASADVLNPVTSTITDVNDCNDYNRDGWHTIEGDFVLVWVVQTSHCSASMHSGPGVLLDDGVLTVYVVQQLSRFRLAQLMLAIDSGAHVSHPNVQCYRCTEYSLEPIITDAQAGGDNRSKQEGIYTLDGEVVPYGPIRGIVRPGAARLLTLF